MRSYILPVKNHRCNVGENSRQRVPWPAARSFLLVLAGCTLPLWLGCAGPEQQRMAQRLTQLEERSGVHTSTLEGLSLKVDSISTGLDRLTERVNGLQPPSSQWMKLEKGTILRWYVDQTLQNVYAQFLGIQGETFEVQLVISAREDAHPLRLRIGEGVQLTLNDGQRTRTFTVRHHAQLVQAGARFAQISFTETQPSEMLSPLP